MTIYVIESGGPESHFQALLDGPDELTQDDFDKYLQELYDGLPIPPAEPERNLSAHKKEWENEWRRKYDEWNEIWRNALKSKGLLPRNAVGFNNYITTDSYIEWLCMKEFKRIEYTEIHSGVDY